MEHQTAVNEHAAERYLLGEMTEAERDDFEDHFFGCVECAGSVRDGATVVDSIRAERRAAAPAPRRFAAWTGAAAAAVLLFVLAAQNAALRRELAATLAPRATAVTFLASASRGAGETPVVVVDRRQPQVALDFDITDQSHPSYRCELRDAVGRVHASVAVTAAQAKDTVRLLVPTRDLEAGNYTLTVDGIGPAPSTVGSYRFIVRVQ